VNYRPGASKSITFAVVSIVAVVLGLTGNCAAGRFAALAGGGHRDALAALYVE